MNFQLDRSSTIIIYGASPMAIMWAERAVGNGFVIKAFIDKNAENIKYVQNIPVITFESYCVWADENNVVIIMLQNVMWHRDIVERLNGIGIRKVIFFPMRNRGEARAVSCLRRKYHECIKFLFSDSLLEIPVLDYLEPYNRNAGIICENIKESVVWAPIELCYSVEREGCSDIWKSDYTQEAIQLSRKYIYNKSLFNMCPYWELFSFLKGEIDDCPLYLKIFGREGHVNTQKYDNDVLLKDRNELIEIFKDEVCKGNAFFEESPADSGMGSLGRVVIYDGMHRSIFLIDSGYYWIPVRLDSKNYKYLYNEKEVQKLKDYLRENHIIELQYPIETFGFYNFPIRCQYLRMVWREITNDITDRKWDLNTVVDFTLTDAYFSRAFYREGVKEVFCLLESESILPVLISNILRIKDIRFFDDVKLFYNIINQCELIITNGKQIQSFVWDDFVWGECLMGIYVYDVLINEAEPIFSRIFDKNRKYHLLKKYTVNGKVNGIYIILG